MAKKQTTKKEETVKIGKPTMTLAEKLKIAKGLTSKINTQYGENIVNFASDPEMADKLKIKYLPTASLKLNSLIGGWARGKFCMAVGLSDTGKTMHMLETIAINQKADPNFMAMWVESESSLEESALDMFGIDRDRFIFLPTNDMGGEKAMDFIKSYVMSGALDDGMVVINSLKLLTPSEEFEKDFEKSGVALAARLNSKFTRVIIPLISKHNTNLTVVQHLSTDIGGYSPGGTPTTITGGLAIKFASMLTLEFRKSGFEASHPLYSMKDDYMMTKVIVKKNHCQATSNPYVQTSYVIRRGKGTDTNLEVLEQAYNNKILVKAGAWIREYQDGMPHEKGNEAILPDGTKASWNGAAKLQEYLDVHPEYFEYIKDKVLSLTGDSSEIEELTAEEIEAIKQENREQQDAYEDIEDLIEKANESLE